MWLSCICASNSVIELNGCTCRAVASQDHATDCVSRSRPCWVHVVLATMQPEGSQVRCVLRPLLVQISASVRCETVARCSAGSLALPLEPPTRTGANTFPGLIQHSSSEWFRTLVHLEVSRELPAHRSVSVCVRSPIPGEDSCLVRWRSTGSLAESTHAHLRNCPPKRAQHANLWTVRKFPSDRCQMYPVSYPSSKGTGRSQV